ncbi:hypothetical protein QQX09_03895 [Demequina sp. SYSU T00192]|uniref:Uncharacterized protein n=1 Tax=Demequina litoralis TaxID=3051660 RepID=A0ABT8G7L8_9MICO|nr:hypothetical protein [Demequina sp. SYSU T00192]MDN4474997.1 hypothetical protein [Demequina sp. SYSU T00192]
MSTDIKPRRGATERITGLIWGAIVTAAGACLIAALSGYAIDLELVAIVALVALGGWLLFSAIGVAMRDRRRETSQQQPVETAVPETDDAAPAPGQGWDDTPEGADRKDS